MSDPGRLKIREGGVWRYVGYGLSGYSGYSGANGYSGVDGSSGYSGYSGVSGYSGSPATTITLNASPATGTASGVLMTLTAGESVAFGAICCIKSDGYVWQANAATTGLFPAQFMALETITSGNSGSFLVIGVATNTSWSWTVGGVIYLASTAGGMTQTQPSGAGYCIQVLGRALAATRVLFTPSADYITHI